MKNRSFTNISIVGFNIYINIYWEILMKILMKRKLIKTHRDIDKNFKKWKNKNS